MRGEARARACSRVFFKMTAGWSVLQLIKKAAKRKQRSRHHAFQNRLAIDPLMLQRAAYMHGQQRVERVAEPGMQGAEPVVQRFLERRIERHHIADSRPRKQVEQAHGM